MSTSAANDLQVPAQIRRDWALNLAENGQFDAALTWLPPAPDDRKLSAFMAVVGARADVAASLLGTNATTTDDASPSADFEFLLRDAATAASGQAQALPQVLSRSSRMGPSVQVSRVVAAAAAPHQLNIAGQAAIHALQGEGHGMAREAVIAAADQATKGAYVEAYHLFQHAIHQGGLTPAEVRASFTNLLAHHQRSDAAVAVAAIGAQVSQPTDEDRKFWRGFARDIAPKALIPHALVQGAPLVLGAALTLMGIRGAMVAVMAFMVWWVRWVPLPGMDLKTSQLVRGLRQGTDEPIKIGFGDVVSALIGGGVGAIVGAWIASKLGSSPDAVVSDASDAALAVGATVGLGLGLFGAAYAWRRAVAWIAARESSQERARRQDDCRCFSVEAFVGPTSRTAVAHLVPEPIASLAGNPMRCPISGVLFLDLPQALSTVRVRDYDPSQASGTASTGMYL